jgi:hypothetical protein
MTLVGGSWISREEVVALLPKPEGKPRGPYKKATDPGISK